MARLDDLVALNQWDYSIFGYYFLWITTFAYYSSKRKHQEMVLFAVNSQLTPWENYEINHFWRYQNSANYPVLPTAISRMLHLKLLASKKKRAWKGFNSCWELGILADLWNWISERFSEIFSRVANLASVRSIVSKSFTLERDVVVSVETW